MAKQLNDRQIKELSQTKEWCLAILNFMISKNGETPGLKMFVEVIIDSYQKQNLKGLKYVNKDINEWARGLPLSDVDELNKLLWNRFGEDLSKQTNRNLVKIAQIIKKGKIANEDEYRLLLIRVDEIYKDESKQDELQTLNNLLADYHR